MLTYEKRVAALTPADVQAAAKRYLRLDNYVQVVLVPEKVSDKLADKATAK